MRWAGTNPCCPCYLHASCLPCGGEVAFAMASVVQPYSLPPSTRHGLPRAPPSWGQPQPQCLLAVLVLAAQQIAQVQARCSAGCHVAKLGREQYKGQGEPTGLTAICRHVIWQAIPADFQLPLCIAWRPCRTMQQESNTVW
jgi:hypothetical protein